MSELDDFDRAATGAAVVPLLDEDLDPERAAASVKLGRTLGLDPSVIYGDFDHYERQAKVALTGSIVSSNAELREFASRHPIIPKLAADDWGNLDELSEKMDKISPGFANVGRRAFDIANWGPKTIRAAGQGFVEGHGSQQLFDWLPDRTEGEREVKAQLQNNLAWLALDIPFEEPIRLLSGLFRGLSEGAKATALNMFKDPALARDIGAATEYHFMFGQHPLVVPEAAARVSQVVRAFELAKPYFSAGKEPPLGVHPFWDQLKIAQVEQDLKTLADLQESAGKSKLRERDPQRFMEFLDRQLKDGKIYVPSENVARLYGIPKVEPMTPEIAELAKLVDPKERLQRFTPTPDDGILGWMPDLADQMEAALPNGWDIAVPLSGWLTHVDKEVARELKDTIKFGPEGISKQEIPEIEARIANVFEAYHGSPHAFEAFSHDLVGTEGGTSYGYGTYLAEEPKVAESYRPEAGVMYRARIHAEKEHFLDWDKSLEEQDPHVKEAIARINATYPEIGRRIEGLTDKRGERIYGAVGRGILRGDIERFATGEGDRVASERLRAEGVPGIKYLDQKSRLADKDLNFQVLDKDGNVVKSDIYDENAAARMANEIGGTYEFEPEKLTYNYVVFDPSIIKILDRNGEALETTRAAAGLPGDYGVGPRPGWQWTSEPKRVSVIAPNGVFALTPIATTPLRDALGPQHVRPGMVFSEEFQRALFDRIGRIAGDVPVYVVSNKDFKELSDAGYAGFYSWEPKNRLIDHIVVSSDTYYSPTLPYVIAHEAIHAATNRVIYDNPILRERIKDVMAEAAAGEEHGGKGIYGFRDEYEFIAEAYTNKGFQEFLKETAISAELAESLGLKEGQGTLWGVIVALIRQALGLKEDQHSALEAAMSLSERAMVQRAVMPTSEVTLLEGGAGKTAGAKQPEIPGLRPVGERPLFETIPSWMNQKQQAKYMEKAAELAQATKEWLANKAEKEVQAKLSKEWKAKAAQVRPEVEEEFMWRPDVVALQLFRSGELEGVKVGIPRINDSLLTPEQRATLPERFQRRDGMSPSDAAQLVGFHTFDELAQLLKSADEALPEKASTRDFLNRLISQEVERRVGKELGPLSETLLDDAQDQVTGATQMELLHEQLVALAENLGQGITFTQQDMKNLAKLKFSQQLAGDVSPERFFRESQKQSRLMELAALEGKWQEAFIAKQAQYLALAMADEAKKFAKAQAQFQRNMRRYRKAEAEGITPQHLNYIHDIMKRIGQEVERSIEHIQAGIAAHGGTLQEFYMDRNGIGLPGDVRDQNVQYSPTMPIAEFLFDPGYGRPTPRDVKSMPVDEFLGVHNSLKALIKNGRDESRFIKQGEAQDLARLMGSMIDDLRSLGKKPIYRPEQAGPIRKTFNFLDHMLAGLLQMEALWDRFDRGNTRGKFTQNFGLPFARAGNQYSALQREFSKKMAALEKFKVDLKEGIPESPFIDPHTADFDPQPMRMNRGNLRAVMLNLSTNLDKMARGHGVDAQKIYDWVQKYAKKEDWDYVQGIWNIYKDIKKLEDEMTMELSGTTIEDLSARSIQTPFGIYDGGYFPMRYDRTRGAGPKEEVEDIPFLRPMTSRGWEKKRTDYAGPLDLGLGTLPSDILRKLKDVAFRPVIIEASKIMLNPKFKSAVTRYYGGPYADLMLPYLKDMAGQAGMTAAGVQALERIGEALRQNIIGTLVGYNPGTVVKHGLSAWSNSMAEVGVGSFLKWFGNTWLNPEVARANYEFAMRGGKIGDLEWGGSAELQRRFQHFEETVGGANDIIMGKPTIRQRLLQWGSRPVAISDLASAVPTWFAQYEKSMREFMPQMNIEKAHTQAVDMADRAVRNAHGSTAITSRPQFMRGKALARGVTSLYGFFNHVFNRYYQMSWRTKEMLQKVGRGDPIARDVADLGNRFLLYMVGPIIAEGVAELELKKDESWPTWLWHSAAHTVTGTVPIMRDAVHAALSGRDPAVGIWEFGLKSLTDLYREVTKKEYKTDRGREIQAGITLGAVATGVGSQTIGKWARFMYDYTHRRQQPKGPGDMYRAFRRGDIRRY